MPAGVSNETPLDGRRQSRQKQYVQGTLLGQKEKLGSKLAEARLNGNIIIGELIRNMELGRFEMSYTVLFPCVFTVYLNPQDHATLRGVFDLVIDDAKKALRARVAELNSDTSTVLGFKRRAKSNREFKIACRDWSIEFLPEPEVPQGDVEIHSELNETAEPGYRGTKTTLLGREPVISGHKTTGSHVTVKNSEPVFAELHYEDESGPQVYLMRQNRVRIGRGGDEQPVDLALYTSDEVSREHVAIQRDAGTGQFSIIDSSTNGTWVDGRRLRKGIAEPLPAKATVSVGEVINLVFEARI